MPEQIVTSLPYRHTQTGYPMLVGLSFGTFAQLKAFARDARAGKPRIWLYLPGILAFVALMLAFSRLTVAVDDGRVTVGFAGGLARRRIDVRQIEKAEVTKTSWLAGWGIRLTPSGWLYNAWGRGAVRLRFAGGRRLTIGTDEPQELLAAIEHARELAAARAGGVAG